MKRFKNDKRLKGLRVLIAEDDEILRSLVTVIFNYAGAETMEVGSGTDCVDIARARCPDLIFMDINMPEMNGVEACLVIKSTDKTKHIPVLLTSSDHILLADIAEKSFMAEGCLPKPFDPTQLLEKAVNIVSVRGSR